MTHGFSTAVGGTFDVLLGPFGAHDDVALSIFSLLCGVAMIFLFKATSQQERIRRTRDVFQARILEMRIYQDDLVLILKALGAALWTNVGYLRLVLVPLLVLGVFAAIVFIQLEARFAHSRLRPRGTALVTVTYGDGIDVMRAPLTMVGEGGAVVDAVPVRVSARREVNWRVRVAGGGPATVTLGVRDASYRFALAASPGTAVVGDSRSRSAIDGLLHPGLPPLPGHTPIERVSVRYPAASHLLFWWRVPWLAVFVFWSFVGALVPKFIFNIRI